MQVGDNPLMVRRSSDELPSGGDTPCQLPPDVSAFTGRAKEISILDGLLQPGGASALALVTGTAGVGKTALVVHWAYQVRDQFPGGQLYGDLRGADPYSPATSLEVLADLLQSLGVTPQEIPAELTARAARYRTLLAGRRILVVLDNAASAEQVRPLLSGSPCVAVVTSRDSLPGLVARDGVCRVSLCPLPAPDALALLHALVGERITEDPDSAAALVQRCGSLPLALRIAAEQASSRPYSSLADLVADLVDGHRLDRLASGDDPRADIRAVFLWSYRALADDVAGFWRALGLFRGADVSIEAAAVLGDVELGTARRMMETLVRTHMVEESGRDRFRLHDLLHEFAAEQTADEDSADWRRATIVRLLTWYLGTSADAVALLNPEAKPPVAATVSHLRPAFDTARAALAWYEAEDHNILAAARQAAEYGAPDLVCELPDVLWRGWYDRHARAAYLVSASQLALDAARHLADPHREARALLHLGRAYREDAQDSDALSTLRAAVTLFQQVGDRQGEAHARNELGLVHSRNCRPHDAMNEHLAALTVFDETEDAAGQARAMLYVGRLFAHANLPYDPVLCFEKAARAFNRLGDWKGEAAARQDLGLYLKDFDASGAALAGR